MKVIYDPRTDSLNLILKDGPVAKSDEAKLGMVLDYHAARDLVPVKILDASKRVTESHGIEFQMAKG